MIQSRLPRWPDRDKVPPGSCIPSRIHPEDLTQCLISTVEGITLIDVNYRAWLEEKSSAVAPAQKSCIEFHHREPLWRRVWRFVHG